jgi:hypothetical protein
VWTSALEERHGLGLSSVAADADAPCHPRLVVANVADISADCPTSNAPPATITFGSVGGESHMHLVQSGLYGFLVS